MRFAAPQWIWLLVCVPLVGAFLVWALRQRAAALRQFADEKVLRKLTVSVSRSRQRLKNLLALFAIAFMSVALMQPQWGYHLQEIKHRGLDIVIALDVSKSMLAEDVKPTRLDAAKREIKSLINQLKGDRIAIVSFAGTAFAQCPLTLDYGAAKLFLDHLDTDSMPLGGTRIGEAVSAGIEAYKGHEKKHRVMFLITDGEDHDPDTRAAVEKAKAAGVVIYPIGIGSAEGAPIPVVDAAGRSGYLKDRSGQVVLSRRNDEALRQLAILTGGKAGVIGTGQFPLEEIYKNQILKMERRELDSTQERRYEHRFQIFLALAMACLVAEALIGERRRYAHS